MHSLKKIITLSLIFFALSAVSPFKIFASCSTYNFHISDPNYPPELCTSLTNGESSGTSVYNCGTFETSPGVWQYACSWHNYICTSSCGVAGGGGSSGGGECPWSAVNCGAGTTINTSQLVGTVVGGLSPPCALGTAQLQGSCAGYTTIPGEPCEWVGCPTKNNPNKMCCVGGTPDESYCARWYINQYACSCGAVAPSNLSFNRTLNTINWTPGTGGTSQKIYVGANQTEVEAGCPGVSSPSCVINQTNLASNTSSYSTAGLLTAGTIYYVRVTNSTGSCSTNSSTLTLASSCTLSPTTMTLNITESLPLISPLTASGLTVNFISSNPAVASVSPASDTTYSYSTTVTGVSAVGSPATVTSNVYSGASLLCSAVATIDVTAIVDPWWQTKDGDITTNGNLTSKVPTNNYLTTVGNGGFPGVPVYGGTFNLSGTTTKISVNEWSGNTSTLEGRLFDYSYFNNLVPQDIIFNDISLLGVAQTEQYGYEWFKTNTSLTIGSDIDFGDRKVILMVEGGDLNLNAKINLTDGSGFFGAFVNGNIVVDPTVTSVATPALEGIYLSDLAFNSGLGTTQLHIRGSVAAHGGILLNRDLVDDTEPAELFEFAPDQILLFPEKLGYRRQRWVEVAP